jgi:hypothetical protein
MIIPIFQEGCPEGGVFTLDDIQTLEEFLINL